MHTQTQVRESLPQHSMSQYLFPSEKTCLLLACERWGKRSETLQPHAFDPLSPPVKPGVPREHLLYPDSDKIQTITHTASKS